MLMFLAGAASVIGASLLLFLLLIWSAQPAQDDTFGEV
jgi:hypothetical protein